MSGSTSIRRPAPWAARTKGSTRGWSLTLSRPLTVCCQCVSPVRTTLKGTIPDSASGREARLGKADASASSIIETARRPFWKEMITESWSR